LGPAAGAFLNYWRIEAKPRNSVIINVKEPTRILKIEEGFKFFKCQLPVAYFAQLKKSALVRTADTSKYRTVSV
jgi:hypothetical protein